MAKDRVTIFIPQIPESVLLVNDGKWTHKNHKGNWAVHDTKKQAEKYARRIPKYQYGSMSSKAGSIDVEYLKYAQDYGDLLISFSVSELYFYNNAIPKSVIDVDDLVNRIKMELRLVMDVTQLPSIALFSVSRDESTVDVIDSSDNIKRRIDILGKSVLPYKNVDNSFKEEGNIYFRGRTGKRSGGQFIAYDKVKEQASKGIDLKELLGLTPRQGILRLEMKESKNPLKRHVKLVREVTGIPKESNESNLCLVMSKEYQVTVLMEVITKLNLDKFITTRTKLISVVKGSKLFTDRELKTAIKVIKHNNGERYSHQLGVSTIKKYDKKILSLGYHFMYSDVELKAITREMVEKAVSTDLTQILM